MPIIEIKALKQHSQGDIPRALKNVTWELAKVLGVPPQAVRAIWTTLQPDYYAEGGDAAPDQRLATHPPIVSITAFAGRPPELVEKAIRCVADNLCHDLALAPGNIFVTYVESPGGRMFTNGAFKR